MLIINRLVGQSLTIGKSIAVKVAARDKHIVTFEVYFAKGTKLKYDYDVSLKESVFISDNIEIKHVGHRGNQVMVGVIAPDHLKVDRLQE